MQWLLIILITANNAESVDQIGPFASQETCEAVEEKIITDLAKSGYEQFDVLGCVVASH